MTQLEIIVATSHTIDQTHPDAQLIALWLHGRPRHTQRAYMGSAGRLLGTLGKPLGAISLADLQMFVDTLAGLSDNTRKQIVATVKSLLTFAHKTGYITINVGAALRTPKAKDELAQRILTEAQVLAMIYKTPDERDAALLRLLYASAARIAEIARLTWVDLQPNGESGQVTLYGKGGKTRTVKLSVATWQTLQALRGDAQNVDPVFRSKKGGALGASQVDRIVRAAAKRAGIKANVSAHWLRHAHASHALDHGASVVLVRDTLGHSSLAITSRYSHARPTDSSALHLNI